MIQSLKIRNVVLIEELEIRFHEGMQVLTGETGAGKSIVVDAVNLILGSRADRGLIRSGCEKASVEAVFDVPGNPEISGILEREGIEYDGRTVVVWRELTASGRNICRICGVMVPVSLLKEIGGKLMDIHGQHEHQFLMDPQMHLQFLDRMAGPEDQEQLARTAKACADFAEVHRKYARLRKENETRAFRMLEMEKSLRELHAAKFRPAEEEELKQESLVLRNSEKIMSVLRNAQNGISTGENTESALERIRASAAGLRSLEGYGDQMKSLAERCESAYYELEEITFELGRLMDESDHDPGRLEKVEERLDLIRRMERKYGPTLPDVLSEQKRMEEEYQRLCSLEDETEEIARTHRQLLAAYRREARELTVRRHRIAEDLERRMMAQLKDLGMEKTVFSVAFQPAPEDRKKLMPQPIGDDRIEFMIRPNPGEPLSSLAKIASGGELSRMMLALKTLEAEGSGVDCMVFDEIDTGISGRMAQAVAEKMIDISLHRQVICVTHLPQIAAAADHQFQVSKAEDGGRTHTSVSELNEGGRIREIGRMISGADGISMDAEQYAARMISAARGRKAGRVQNDP